MLSALEGEMALEFFQWGPPGHGRFEHADAVVGKHLPDHATLLLLAELRKAETDIDSGYMPALWTQPVKQPAPEPAEPDLPAPGKAVQQPQ